jgi:hypothetical protein
MNVGYIAVLFVCNKLILQAFDAMAPIHMGHFMADDRSEVILGFHQFV